MYKEAKFYTKMSILYIFLFNQKIYRKMSIALNWIILYSFRIIEIMIY